MIEGNIKLLPFSCYCFLIKRKIKRHGNAKAGFPPHCGGDGFPGK
jgi:hypothetical protein